MTSIFISAFFWACGEKASTLPAVLDTAETDTDSVDTSSDTEEEIGTDEDGDGFTVEEGDCDDTDPWTNPARSEEAGDGIDNDCDGRVDEKWSGITVSLLNSAGLHHFGSMNKIR